MKIEPLPIGTEYDGSKIIKLMETDVGDPYQPHLYLMENGLSIWIPADCYPKLLATKSCKGSFPGFPQLTEPIMNESYFVIFGYEDGEPSMERFTKKELIDIVLSPNMAGDFEYGKRTALKNMPVNIREMGGDKMLIIKGEIVVPKPKTTVIEYDLP